jgi:hypothetical protein
MLGIHRWGRTALEHRYHSIRWDRSLGSRGDHQISANAQPAGMTLEARSPIGRAHIVLARM